MIESLTRRALRGALSWIGSLLAVGLWLSPAAAQQSSALCILISNVVNGVTTTSCVPVSAANPLPILLQGAATATLTAGTTPTSGFTAGQLLMSNGTTIGPAGAAVGTSLNLTGGLTATAFTAAGNAGVSCAAGTTSSTTMVVTDGIVTHC